MQMKAMITRNVAAQQLRTRFRTGDGTGKSDDDLQSRFGREPWLMPYTDETLKCSEKKAWVIFR